MGVARPMTLLYGGSTPVGPMDWVKQEGPMHIVNRSFESYSSWIADAHNKGCEVLYYINLMEYPVAWTPVNEEQRLYGGYSGGAASLPNNWWWTGSYATSGNRVNYSGQRMLNIRPGAPPTNHFVSWVVDFWSRWNGYFDGFFLDVLGNRLWVGVWNTMISATDTLAGDGRTEAQNWIRGVHNLISRLRTALGPEPIMVANNRFDSHFTGTTATPNISGGYSSMEQGGHPALNGCMLEGSGHSVQYCTETFNGSVNSTNPNGSIWATLANNRKRFHRLCSGAASSNYVSIVSACTNISQYFYCGAASSYESTAQTPVPGTVMGRVGDHYVNWRFGGGGSTPDTTPPSAPTGLTTTVTNQSVQVNYTLPALDDRVLVTIYRKSTAWGASEGPGSATQVASLSESSAISSGAHSYTENNVPVGTWYYKAFTQDAAGNIQAGGPSATAQTTSGGGTGTVPIYGPASDIASLSVGVAVPIYGPASDVVMVAAPAQNTPIYGPASNVVALTRPPAPVSQELAEEWRIAQGLRTGSFSSSRSLSS